MTFGSRSGILVSAALIGGLFAAMPPAHAQAQSVTAHEAPVAGTDGVSQAVLFQILMAEIALQRGQLGPAWSTYMAVARDTRDPRLAKRAVEIAYAERVLDRAVDSAKLWTQLAPGDREAESTLVSLLVESGRLADAEPLIAARIAQAPNKGAAIEDVQRLLARAPTKSEALAVLDRLSKGQQGELGVRLALARAAALAGNTDRAVDEARAALKIDPSSEIAALTAAQLLTARAPADAERLLNDYLERNPNSVEVRLALARAYAAHGEYGPARAALQRVIAVDPNNLDALLAIGLVSMQARNLDDARSELQVYLNQAAERGDDARDTDAALFALAEIAEERKQYDEANTWLNKVEEGDQYLTAQTRIARNLARMERIDDARTLLRALPARNSAEQQQLVAAEAQALREAHQYKPAFEVLEAGVKDFPNAAELLYDFALAAEKVDRTDVMEASLRRVIALRPADPNAYNALGYWLADRTNRLDESETLIEKALSMAPDDAYIIDSMGWLQYRRGRIDRATELLERAYRSKADPEIAAHLGEVYWAAGQRDKAEAIWRMARDRDPTNETLVETLARYSVSF